MSTSAAQAIPSLISLVKHADAVLQVPLEPNTQLLPVHVEVNCRALCVGCRRLIDVE